MATILTKGDIGIILSFTAKSAAGSTIDLSGATVKFQLFNQCCNKILDVSCLILSPIGGTCQYTTVSPDLDIPAGEYTGSLKITYSPSKVLTSSQFTVKIVDACHIE